MREQVSQFANRRLGGKIKLRKERGEKISGRSAVIASDDCVMMMMVLLLLQ